MLRPTVFTTPLLLIAVLSFLLLPADSTLLHYPHDDTIAVRHDSLPTKVDFSQVERRLADGNGNPADNGTPGNTDPAPPEDSVGPSSTSLSIGKPLMAEIDHQPSLRQRDPEGVQRLLLIPVGRPNLHGSEDMTDLIRLSRTTQIQESITAFCEAQGIALQQCVGSNTNANGGCDGDSYGAATCNNYTLNMYQDCINAGSNNSNDLPECVNPKLNVVISISSAPPSSATTSSLLTTTSLPPNTAATITLSGAATLSTTTPTPIPTLTTMSGPPTGSLPSGAATPISQNSITVTYTDVLTITTTSADGMTYTITSTSLMISTSCVDGCDASTFTLLGAEPTGAAAQGQEQGQEGVVDKGVCMRRKRVRRMRRDEIEKRGLGGGFMSE
ncbi:MAG: hypothetical protein M1827_005345 [Pycnora praestabilis]|nr:MAG: hypothetical protein M1827_005345 [Pycnora praestabilis]